MFGVSKLSSSSKALIFSFSSITLGLGFCAYTQLHPSNKTKKQPYSAQSLSTLLPHYGFQTPAQKQALVFLMQQASILEPQQSLEDRFPTRKNPDELLKDLLTWVQLTQNAFTIRQGHQERWEVKAPAWIQQNPTAILEALGTLNMTEAVKPKHRHPDVLCILGATRDPMIKRLQYAKELLEDPSFTTKHLVLLAGERPVTVGVDGNQALLEKIAKDYDIQSLSKLTETHLIQEAYKTVGMPEDLALTVIDTPAGHLPRPTTETTIIELNKWLKQHPEYTSISFVSNQPHVYYQAAVIQTVLERQGSNLKIDVIGPAIASSTPRIETIVGSLGSRIWASTPHVIQTLNLETQNSELLQLHQTLYKNQPLVYKDKTNDTLSKTKPK